MAEFINTWGMYHFYPEEPENLVHMSDLPKVLKMLATWNGYVSFGYLFQCVGIEDGYLRLRGEVIEFRASRDKFVHTPAPRFVIGDKVKLKKKPEQIRRVVRLHFHFQREVVVYHVETSDIVGRTYWFEDQLIPVDS